MGSGFSPAALEVYCGIESRVAGANPLNRMLRIERWETGRGGLIGLGGSGRPAFAQLLGGRAALRIPDSVRGPQLPVGGFGESSRITRRAVSDDKLIKEAISGMVPGLDPHSDFSTLAFKDLQISTQGSSGGLGIEVGVEDGIVRVCRRSRTPRRSAPASNPATSSSR